MIIIAKKKRSKVAPIKPVYEYKEREFIIKDKFGWMKYRDYSSKKSAQEGVKTLKRIFGRKRDSKLTSVRTSKGWAVFQLAKEGYRTKASEIIKHGKKKY